MKAFVIFMLGCISACVTLLVMAVGVYSSASLTVVYFITCAICAFVYGWIQKGSLREWLKEFV